MLLAGRVLTLAGVLRSPSSLVHVRCVADASGGSVSGLIYSAPADKPTVRLFTKAGCTLCDVAKGVLADVAADRPHTLEAVDITDAEHAGWWDKYKYDIPVLHIDGKYWAKHRLTTEGALEALTAAEEKRFEACTGEPDAARLERRR
jgi:hypothetical protein